MRRGTSGTGGSAQEKEGCGDERSSQSKDSSSGSRSAPPSNMSHRAGAQGPHLSALSKMPQMPLSRGARQRANGVSSGSCPWGANPDLGSTCLVPGTAECGKKGKWTPTSLLRHTQRPDSSGGLGPTSPKALKKGGRLGPPSARKCRAEQWPEPRCGGRPKPAPCPLTQLQPFWKHPPPHPRLFSCHTGLGLPLGRLIEGRDEVRAEDPQHLLLPHALSHVPSLSRICLRMALLRRVWILPRSPPSALPILLTPLPSVLK